MATTSFKGYELIVTGTEVDTWGDKLNTDVFTRIDANLGGITSKTLGGINVTLDATENRNMILRLTGVLSANVLVTTTLQGVMMVENLTTGAFNVTFTNGFGSPLTLPQNARSVIIADATNGARAVASNVAAVPSGTRMLFQQTAAPVGWTKDVAAGMNNKALRLVNGAVGTGGTVAFTDAFKSQSIMGTIGGTALSVAQLPAHSHLTFKSQTGSGGSSGLTNANEPNETGHNFGNSNSYSMNSAGATDADVGKSSNTGSGDTHGHSFTGTALDLAVAYVDLIVAVKD
jgi:hypothetical protein